MNDFTIFLAEKEEEAGCRDGEKYVKQITAETLLISRAEDQLTH